MTDAPAAVHLIRGDEELLVQRAVSSVIADMRVRSGPDLPVDRVRAGDVSAPELAELLSPSLFADDRVIVLESAAEAGKDAVALIAEAAADPPEGVVLIVLHSGGGRAKALAGQLEKGGAVVHECAKITKASERIDFVRGEFRALKTRVSPDVVTAVLDAVGSDLRELAAACSQLVADTGGVVNEQTVSTYYAGKAEVTGFEIADKAVSGRFGDALEALRWALLRGTPQVLVADALAEAVHTIARVGSARGSAYSMASALGMPPWRVEKAQKQARRWDQDTIAQALVVVAQLNGEVKGQVVSPDYALERAVSTVAKLAMGR